MPAQLPASSAESTSSRLPTRATFDISPSNSWFFSRSRAISRNESSTRRLRLSFWDRTRRSSPLRRSTYLSSPLRRFGLEARPCALVLTVMLVLKQAECFLCAELRDSGEVFSSEPIQNLGAAEFARSRAEWTRDGFCRHWRSHVICPRDYAIRANGGVEF